VTFSSRFCPWTARAPPSQAAKPARKTTLFSFFILGCRATRQGVDSTVVVPPSIMPTALHPNMPAEYRPPQSRGSQKWWGPRLGIRRHCFSDSFRWLWSALCVCGFGARSTSGGTLGHDRSSDHGLDNSAVAGSHTVRPPTAVSIRAERRAKKGLERDGKWR
jgi:hypothetical protein